MIDYYKLVFLFIFCLNLSCNSQVKTATEITSSNVVENVNPPTNVNIDNTKESLPLKTTTPVNSVDFDNFTFPVCPKVLKSYVPNLKDIKLKNGELEIEKGQFGNTLPYIKFSLLNVSYYDLTNDKQLDAVITMVVKYFQGTDHCTYVYSQKNKQPNLIWTHEYENGIRKVAFEQGGLLIEEYNNSRAVCCPTEYTRSLFNWNGNGFIKASSEVIPNETKNREFLGFPDN